MNKAVQKALREILPASVAFRHTDTKPEEASHVILGMKANRCFFIGHSKNQLDGYRIRRVALGMSPDLDSITVQPIPRAEEIPSSGVQKGR